MRIREITLRELGMKLVAPFETSVVRTDERRIVLVEMNVDGVTGWGECVAGETPGYSPETTETAWHVLRDHLWPLLRGEEFVVPADGLEHFPNFRARPRAQHGLGVPDSCFQRAFGHVVPADGLEHFPNS